MRKRIFTLLAALCLLLCLLPTAAFASQTGGKTDESRSYNFDLSVGGASEVRATTGETITVTLVLKRTDAQENADMYGMQFMCHTRGRQGQKYSSLQFWRGRIKIVSVGA